MSTDIPPAAKYPSDPYYYKADRGAQLASLFFLLFLVFLLLLCIYCFCRWCGQQRQHRAAALMSILSGDADVQVHELDNDPGLNSSVIASLPTFTHRKRSSSHQNSEGPERTLECAVCLGAIEEGEVGRLLPNCSHVFHVECIDKWLGVNSTCPVCRGKVVSVKEATAAGAVDADRQGAETTTSSGMRIPADELSDVGDVTESEAASTDGSVVTAEIGSNSQLVSLFRKMVGRD